MKKVLIRDLTLRDGQQSLFATRMSQAQIDKVLPLYKTAGFYAMEVWGGAVPDSIMRYLGEDPWVRLESIHNAVGGVSKLTALSRGRNLFGYAPYPNEVIEGFCKNAMGSGLNIMRIFDALNDRENVISSINYVKKFGGIADCAVCYTVDPQFSMMERLKGMLTGKKLPKTVFTDQYFIDKAVALEKLGADMITLKDMAGLVTPTRARKLIKGLKDNVKIPIDFHTHCTPGYGLASILMAMLSGVDIIDTNIWYFSGGPAAPSIEFIDLFARKLGISTGVDMASVRKINEKLLEIRKELAPFDTCIALPKPFDYDGLPAAIDKLFDQAIEAAKKEDEEQLLKICHQIEEHYNFPKPDDIVKNAQIPGGMYTNMLAQLKALKSEHVLDQAMKLIPHVRLDAGLSPLVTPTSQIIGAQAVSCAISLNKGNDMYATVSNQFENLIKGEYGTTPIEINPAFRKKITGNTKEMPYDISQYKQQPNPELAQYGGVTLVTNEKERLLLELFPNVANDFLNALRKKEYDKAEAEREAAKAKSGNTTEEAPQAAKPVVEEKPKHLPITGEVIKAPLPGKVLELLVKPGDVVKSGQTLLVLEAMKMENDIRTTTPGVVKQIFVKASESVASDAMLVEIVPA